MEKARSFLSGRRGRNTIYFSQVTRKALRSPCPQERHGKELPKPWKTGAASRREKVSTEAREAGTASKGTEGAVKRDRQGNSSCDRPAIR